VSQDLVSICLTPSAKNDAQGWRIVNAFTW